MVEALKGTANIAITGRPRDKNRKRVYQLGNSSWKSIHKTDVEGCREAWRYSEPLICNAPKNNNLSFFELKDKDEYLKSFYDLLAMIQAECFMCTLVNSRPIKVSDSEMKLLEWLHEFVRNKYEHFIPNTFMVSVLNSINASEICLKLSYEIIFESGNVILNIPSNTKNLISEIRSGLERKKILFENYLIEKLIYKLPITAPAKSDELAIL